MKKKLLVMLSVVLMFSLVSVMALADTIDNGTNTDPSMTDVTTTTTSADTTAPADPAAPAENDLTPALLTTTSDTPAPVAATTETGLPAAVDGVITLTGDVDLSSTGWTVEGSTTLDLDGHSLKLANTTAGNIKVSVGASLTLTDSTDINKDGTGNGKIYTETDYSGGDTGYGVIAVSGGSFTMESGYINTVRDNAANKGQFAVTVGQGGSITINGGKIEAGWYAISGNGTDVVNQSQITVNGGNLISTADYALYLPHNGVTTIKNGVVDGAAGGVAQMRGTLNIEDGTIASQGTGNTGEWGDGTGGMGNAAINVGNTRAGTYGDCTVNISGGNFTANKDALMIAKKEEHTYKVAITVTGGTYNKIDDVKAYIADTHVATTEGGKYVIKPLTLETAEAKIGETPYKTLAEAITKATKDQTVTLLKDAECGERIWINQNMVLDLGGFTLTSSSDYTLLVSNGKSLTLKNGVLKTTNNSAAAIFGDKASTITVEKDAILETAGAGILATNNNAGGGHATLNIYGTLNSNDIGIWGQGPKNTINVEGATINSNYFGVYQNGSFGGSTFTIKNSTITDTMATGIYISNSNGNTTKADQGWQTLKIENSTITGKTAVEVKYTNVEIKDSTLTATGTPVSVEGNNNGSTATGWALAVSHNGKFKEGQTVETADAAAGIINIDGGYYKGVVGTTEPIGEGQKTTATITVKSGYFSSDPSAYCTGDLTGVPNTEAATSSEYPFTVGKKSATAATVATGTPEVKATVTGTDAEKQLAAQAVTALTAENAQTAVTGGSLDAAATAIAQANTEKPEDYNTQLGVTEANKKTVTIVVEQYINIQVTGVTTTAAAKTLELNITPMAQKYATTADLANADAKIDADSVNKNAVRIGKPQPLTVTGKVTITLPLPSDFVTTGTNTLNVKHEKSNGKTYIYTGNVEQNVLTFTNPNGFSKFTIGAKAAVATIGEVGYESLQAAVDEVKDGDTIILAQDGEATVANRDVTFTVKPADNTNAKATIKDYRGNVIKPDAQNVYTVTAVAISGGGGGGSRNYAITTDCGKNGEITVSPKSATKGTTVTVTVEPDEGYELDELTVTDRDGKSIKVTKGKGGKYTFTMPNGKATVKAEFAKAGESQPDDETGFVDIKANAWYADAVQYVVDKGMMNGTDSNHFSPNDNTTRGQIVTVLYRLEKEPATGKAAFTDVADGQYYAKAVAWAAEKEVVKGYTETTFAPNDNITREQIAAILFRYAEFKNIEAKADGDLTVFTDAAKVSDWAQDAMKWAVGCGLMEGDNGALNPQGNATRAEIATMLMRFCENVAK